MNKLPVHRNKDFERKVFETKEDFDKFYELNKNEIDVMSSIALNKKFLINGFRIGRRKNNMDIYLIENLTKHYVPTLELSDKTNFTDEDISPDAVKDLEARVKNIEDFLSKIYKR